MIKATGVWGIALAAVLLSAAPAAAERPGVCVQLGVTFAEVRSKDLNNLGLDWHKGLLAGGAICPSPQKKPLAFQPEVLINQKGARDGLTDTSFNLTSLSVPLLARIEVGQIEKVPIYVFAGPSINVNLSAGLKDPTGSLDLKDFVKRVDYSLVLGLGVALVDGRVGLQIRLEEGLTSFVKLETESAKNRSLTVLVQPKVFGW